MTVGSANRWLHRPAAVVHACSESRVFAKQSLTTSKIAVGREHDHGRPLNAVDRLRSALPPDAAPYAQALLVEEG